MNPLSLSLRLLATFILTLGLTSTLHAEIFKWTDAQGNVHYSQTPPQDKDTEAEDIAEDIGMAAGTGRKTPDQNVAKSAEDDEMTEARKKGEKNMVKHKTFCDQQNSALKQLLSNPVIRWKTDKEERILTAKERTNKIKEFENNIKDMCNADVLASKEKVGAQ